MKLRLRLVKSPIGYEKSQRATLAALGLGKLGSERVHEDTPTVRGMIRKVSHLVEVREVTAGEEGERNATS